jgi:hypothetical protein
MRGSLDEIMLDLTSDARQGVHGTATEGISSGKLTAKLSSSQRRLAAFLLYKKDAGSSSHVELPRSKSQSDKTINLCKPGLLVRLR